MGKKAEKKEKKKNETQPKLPANAGVASLRMVNVLTVTRGSHNIKSHIICRLNLGMHGTCCS